MHFDTKRVTVNLSPEHSVLAFGLVNPKFDFNDDIWVGRIGVNYRFSLEREAEKAVGVKAAKATS